MPEYMVGTYRIRAKRLPSGYYRIQGQGPCEWAQPERWPCSERHLRESAFAEASERFVRAVLAAMQQCPAGGDHE